MSNQKPKDKGGHPRHFKTPKEMQKVVDTYLEHALKEKIPLTMTGLAIALGFDSRQSLYDYEKMEGYSYIVKRARLHVENGYELSLSASAPTGAIFALKNMGWVDKTEIKADVQQVVTEITRSYVE